MLEMSVFTLVLHSLKINFLTKNILSNLFCEQKVFCLILNLYDALIFY